MPWNRSKFEGSAPRANAGAGLWRDKSRAGSQLPDESMTTRSHGKKMLSDTNAPAAAMSQPYKSISKQKPAFFRSRLGWRLPYLISLVEASLVKLNRNRPGYRCAVRESSSAVLLPHHGGVPAAVVLPDSAGSVQQMSQAV